MLKKHLETTGLIFQSHVQWKEIHSDFRRNVFLKVKGSTLNTSQPVYIRYAVSSQRSHLGTFHVAILSLEHFIHKFLVTGTRSHH
jgi:hypothetical protein